LGREKARVLTLNLRNRMIFREADEEGDNESADFLGRKNVTKKSWGYSGGRQSNNYSELEEHKIKPRILSSLARHTVVLVHCERGFKKTLMPQSVERRRIALVSEMKTQSLLSRIVYRCFLLQEQRYLLPLD